MVHSLKAIKDATNVVEFCGQMRSFVKRQWSMWEQTLHEGNTEYEHNGFLQVGQQNIASQFYTGAWIPLQSLCRNSTKVGLRNGLWSSSCQEGDLHWRPWTPRHCSIPCVVSRKNGESGFPVFNECTNRRDTKVFPLWHQSTDSRPVIQNRCLLPWWEHVISLMRTKHCSRDWREGKGWSRKERGVESWFLTSSMSTMAFWLSATKNVNKQSWQIPPLVNMLVGEFLEYGENKEG